MNDSNVIIFPYVGETQPTTLDEIRDRLKDVYTMHVSETVDVLMELMIDQLEVAGFPIRGNQYYSKDIALVSEALRATLMKHKGIPHPLNKLSAQLYEHMKNDDTQVFCNYVILDKVNSD